MVPSKKKHMLAPCQTSPREGGQGSILSFDQCPDPRDSLRRKTFGSTQIPADWLGVNIEPLHLAARLHVCRHSREQAAKTSMVCAFSWLQACVNPGVPEVTPTCHLEPMREDRLTLPSLPETSVFSRATTAETLCCRRDF